MSKGLKRLLLSLVVGLALYSWLGFLMLPSLALQVINQQLANYATTPAHVQRLELNPFTLELNVWGFQVGEPDDQQLGLQHLYAQVDSSSLWQRNLHLKQLSLTEPSGQVILNPQGELNLAQLFNLPQSADKPEDPASTALAVLIDRIDLLAGHLRFNDQRQAEPVDITFADINITLHHLDTRPAGHSELQLSTQASDGSQLHWQGDLSLNPLTSNGHLKLQDAQLTSWWPYVSPHFSAKLHDGRLTLDTQYEFELQPQLKFKAKQLSAQLNALALDQHAEPLARLKQLSISDSSFDLTEQRVHLGNVSSQGLTAWADLDKNGMLNWQKLLPKPPVPSADSAPTTPETNTQNNPAWHISVQQADFSQHKFHLADHSRSQPVAIALSDFNLRIKDFDSQTEQPFSAELNTGVGEQGQLSSHAQVLLAPFNLDMTLNSSDLDLRPAQAWISPFVHANLRSGLLNSSLKLNLHDLDNLQLAVEGDAAITQLHVTDSIRERDLAKWQTVDVNGIQYSLQAQKLSIDSIALEQPYVRFIINEDLTTNLSELMIEQPATAPADTTQTDRPEFAMHIGGIQINDGSANFADFSLQPNFATAMQKLNGSIGTLDNQSNSVAQVDIKGSIDRYAPVTIKGSLMPFDPLKQLDIATAFKHVELTTLTPYSGKFAGYRIQKGRLNLDLHYKITDGKLDATNQLLLEELQLGERVDSPDAVDLPVRLAVALLKDRKGQIAIDLPVQGDLNNPEFSVAPIIWQTLRNLITRAVSAPFNFIAGLASGDGQDLNEVAFAAGEFTINAQAAKNLDVLAKALQERPELRLEIEGGSHRALDGPPLAELRLAAAYRNAWYRILQSRGTKIESSKDELQVPEQEKPALLEGIYRTAIKQQPPIDWDQLKKAERFEKMQTAVLRKYAQSALGLRRLAQARANSIKEYLIEQTQLDAERVYLVDVSEGKGSAEQGVISTLHLGSL